MSDVESSKAPLTRPRFTEEIKEFEMIKQDSFTRKTTEHIKELERLKELPIITGRATISMMEQFRKFPWAQDTMIGVGRSDVILIAFLRKYLEIDGRDLENWQTSFELHHRAMLSLSVYETYTPAENRARMDVFMEEWKEEEAGKSKYPKQDPLGNSMVDSSRRLSGEQKKKQKKIRKPRKLKVKSKESKEQKSKGRGRGGKVIRGKGRAYGVKPLVEDIKLPKIKKRSKLKSAPRKRRRSASAVSSRRSEETNNLSKSTSRSRSRGQGNKKVRRRRRSDSSEHRRGRRRDRRDDRSAKRRREKSRKRGRSRSLSRSPRYRIRDRGKVTRRFTNSEGYRSTTRWRSGGRFPRRMSRSSERRGRSAPRRETQVKAAAANKVDGVAAIQSSLKDLEARLEARMNTMTTHLNLVRNRTGGDKLRQDFLAAALRLPDGDPLKETAIRDYQLNTSAEGVPQQWAHKANTENFRRWLQAPEGAAPFDLNKIFRSLGYKIDISQRNLPPAVPCILLSLILAEAQNKEQIVRAARWFLEVAKEGFRFSQAHHLLELFRRAIELRRSSSSS